MSPFWILLKQDDGGGGDNWSYKLQSNHHHQQANIQFFYRPDALPVTQPTVSKTEGKYVCKMLIITSTSSRCSIMNQE